VKEDLGSSEMLCCVNWQVATKISGEHIPSSILNADNKMNTEIAERIQKGNKTYFANAKLIKSTFLNKNTKIKIYRTMIRLVIMCSSETWTLTAQDENNLRIF
jgi:hypothetical protein